jgi:hypothetical protein
MTDIKIHDGIEAVQRERRGLITFIPGLTRIQAFLGGSSTVQMVN